MPYFFFKTGTSYVRRTARKPLREGEQSENSFRKRWKNIVPPIKGDRLSPIAKLLKHALDL